MTIKQFCLPEPTTVPMGILKTCQVIQAMASNGGRLTVAEIDKIVDLPKAQIMSILPRLIQQGRVLKEKPPGQGKFRYWFNDNNEYESKRGGNFSSLNKAAKSRKNPSKKTRPLYQRVQFGEEKIQLLQRVYEMKIPPAQKLLVRSMLMDYGVDIQEEK